MHLPTDDVTIWYTVSEHEGHEVISVQHVSLDGWPKRPLMWESPIGIEHMTYALRARVTVRRMVKASVDLEESCVLVRAAADRWRLLGGTLRGWMLRRS